MTKRRPNKIAKQVSELPPFVKIDEAAATLNVSPGHISNAIESGRLLAIDVSSPPHTRKHYRIVRESLQKFVDDGMPKERRFYAH